MDRSHDAVMAERAQVDSDMQEHMRTLVLGHLEYKKSLQLRSNGGYSNRRRNDLVLMHMLTQHYEVDSLMFARLTRECEAKPEVCIWKHYETLSVAMAEEAREKRIANAATNLLRATNDQQHAILQERLKRANASETPAYRDVNLERVIQVITHDAVSTQIKDRAMVPSTRLKDKYDSLCTRCQVPHQTQEQLHKLKLIQYKEVMEEFADEDSLNVPVTTDMIHKWFNGERSKYQDGCAFWNEYAKACGYVDEHGVPHPMNGTVFHIDHIFERKNTRTRSRDGSWVPCPAVDHWTNYAVHYAAVNRDRNMWQGAVDTVSELKEFIHGQVSCEAICSALAQRHQQHARTAQQMATQLKRLGHNSSTNVKAWQVPLKFDAHVGKIMLNKRSRKSKTSAAPDTSFEDKSEPKRRACAQQLSIFESFGVVNDSEESRTDCDAEQTTTPSEQDVDCAKEAEGDAEGDAEGGAEESTEESATGEAQGEAQGVLPVQERYTFRPPIKKSNASGKCKFPQCTGYSQSRVPFKGYPFCIPHRKIVSGRIQKKHGSLLSPLPRGFNFSPYYTDACLTPLVANHS